MSAKINSVWGAILFLALVTALSGCTPAGPRALLKGKKYLDRGDAAGAVAEFKVAAELLATNAVAYDYLGVALQRAGQTDAAIMAYDRALELNRDLLEAHLNLGVLYLEQNRPDEAKTELTAYTLRRPNEPAGWLKLGSAQLKLGETVPAERSFSAVLALKTSDAEAYNGLGLARIQRGRPREAAQFFTAAVQARPDYPAAILNLASVSQQYLHDNKTALENYRAYLALAPRPANWDAVNAIVNGLEQSLAPAAVAVTPPPAAPATRPNPPAAATVAETRPAPRIYSQPVTHPPVPPREPAPYVSQAPPAVRPTVTHVAPPVHPVETASATPPPAAPVQVVQIAPETRIVTAPTANASGVEQPVPEVPMPEPAPKSSLWNRLFTPAAPEVKPPPVVIVPPAPVNYPRYNYLSPRHPLAGDRRAASGAFTQARVAEQNESWTEALKDYREAVALDPAWFEAQYNTGVIAHRLRNYDSALASYETALAIEPASVDARYNFALALKAAGYAPDAANELRKILAANPGEVRAHLALANLCAQSLHDPLQARQHYLQVLELDPKNPQTADIRFWLAANPG